MRKNESIIHPTQSHERNSKVFEERETEVKFSIKKMDSDGILQTDYNILNKTVHPEFTLFLVDLFPNKSENSSSARILASS